VARAGDYAFAASAPRPFSPPGTATAPPRSAIAPHSTTPRRRQPHTSPASCAPRFATLAAVLIHRQSKL